MGGWAKGPRRTGGRSCNVKLLLVKGTSRQDYVTICFPIRGERSISESESRGIQISIGARRWESSPLHQARLNIYVYALRISCVLHR